MPRIPVYDAPQVESRALPGVRQSSVASPSLFGAGAEQEVALGKGLLNAGTGIAAVALKMQAEDNETEAKALDTEFANFGRDVLNGANGDPSTGYLSRQGKAALDDYGKAQEALLKKKQELVGKASNDRVRTMLDQTFNQRLLGFRDTMDGHARQQRQNHMKATVELRVDSLANDMADNWADEKKHGEYLAGLKNEAASLAEINGITGEDERKEFVRKYTSAGHGRVLSRMISLGKTDDAGKYLDKYGAEVEGGVRDQIAQKLETAGTLGKGLDTFKAIITTAKSEKDAKKELDGLYSAGKIKQPVYDNAMQRIEHEFAKRKQSENEWSAAMLGKAQEWVIKNPGKPVTDMPIDIYNAAKNKGHLAQLDAFAQREGRPADRMKELTTRGALLDQAMNDPDAFVAEFRRSQFSDRMDLGVQGIREMQNIAGEMIRGDGKYRSAFNPKTLQDAVPKALLASDKKNERDAFVAIMSEEAERWRKANPGKQPDAAAYAQVAKAANAEWVSIGSLWNTNKPAYQARAAEDAKAVPKWFYDASAEQNKRLASNRWARDEAIASDWAKASGMPQSFYENMRKAGATHAEAVSAWELKKGKR